MYVEDVGTGELLIWVQLCLAINIEFLLHVVGIRSASKYGFR